MAWSEYYGCHHGGFTVLVWLAQILYVICFIPQIRENLRLHSERGLSDLFLLGNMNIYLVLLFDIFCNEYPYPYKITAFLQLFGAIALVCQSFYYDFSPKRARKMLVAYCGNIIIALACIPFAIYYSHVVGEFSAWFLLLLFSISFISQALKIYQEKSVKGFSFSFITLFAIANVIEFFLWFCLHLPLPYFLYTVQSIVMYIIFFIQFLLYSKSRKYSNKTKGTM